MLNTFANGYALLVGVGNTAQPQWSLPVTVKDVQAVRSVLTDPNLCAYPDDDDHIRFLHDKTADRHNILDGLSWLQTRAAADKEATVVVYYSGHGWIDRSTGKYYLIPYEIDSSDPANSALPAQDFIEALRGIAARRLLVIMDCCHAQGMATAKEGAAEEEFIKAPPGFEQSVLPKSIVADLKKGEGRAVLLSCREKELSRIRPQRDLSIFTFHLLEAMQGSANRPGDLVVRISNLMNHLSQTVLESANQMYGMAQTPFFDMAAEDFAVAMLRGGKGLPVGGSQPTDSKKKREKQSGGARKKASAARKAFAPGKSFVAAAAFISIKDLEKISEGLDAYRAISVLHQSIKNSLNEGGFANVIVLSSLTGAIIIIPDKLQIDSSVILDDLLKSVFSQATTQGLPLRVGLTHGDLLPLEDIDKGINFIGTCLNVAARLSMSKDNAGMLVHESFAKHLSSSIDSTHYLSSKNRKEILVYGKREEKFICFSPPAGNWEALNDRSITSKELPKQKVNAAIVAYDLPNFSDGDLLMLSQRFRSITDVFRQLELSDKGFYFSPGGDGGIFILPGMEKENAYDIAEKFAKKLETESINREESIWVNCRIGVHHGGILLYENAEGLLRPAGTELFIADKIAGGAGEEGKRAPTIVFSDRLKEAINPSSQLFAEKYVELAPLNIFNENIRRYMERTQPKQEPPRKEESPAMQNADENRDRIKQERREALELFERLHPRDQLDRLIYLLEMPSNQQPSRDLEPAQREDKILKYYAGIPNGLQKVIEELRYLIAKQGRP